MTDHILLTIGLVFVALAVILTGLAVQDSLTEKERQTIAGKVRFKIAFIFSVVAIGLAFLNTFIR